MHTEFWYGSLSKYGHSEDWEANGFYLRDTGCQAQSGSNCSLSCLTVGSGIRSAEHSRSGRSYNNDFELSHSYWETKKTKVYYKRLHNKPWRCMLFLTSPVQRCEWSVTGSGYFNCRGEPLVSSRQGWVSPRISLEVKPKTNVPAPAMNHTLAGKSIASNFTDWGITTHIPHR
jgi:hypothetical protein